MYAKVRKREVLIPFFSFLFLNLLVLFLWDKSITAQKLALQERVHNSGELLSQKFLSIVKSDIQSLENLKHRFEITDGDYFNFWEHDAELILQQNASFKFIEWIDNFMIIRKISPSEGNEAAIGLDISKVDYRRDEWVKHSIDGSMNITPWSKMTQGGHAFLVDVPVYFNGEFKGTITAGMDFKENLDAFAENLPDYSIEIKDENNSVFYTQNQSEIASKDFMYTNVLKIDSLDNQNWSIKVSPASASFLSEKSSSTNNMLILGIALSTLMSLLIYFYLRSRLETQRAIRANKKLKITNKKLSTQRNRAEKASRAKTEFLSNMSHEIRTPLNGILGLIQLVKKSDKTDNYDHYIDLMDQSSKNLLDLVNDVLEIDKIESGKVSLKETVYNPSKAITTLVSQFKDEFESKSLYLDLKSQSTTNFSVIGDEGKFNQVIINLLKNALKFTSSGGATVIYEESLVNNVVTVNIKVSDTGIGIPQHTLSKIFKRFTQVDQGIKKKHEGSGLGLAICENLILLMGGKISVESQLDVGSTFQVNVPFKISDKQLKDVNSLNDDISHLDFSDLKVLVVDDNNINVLVLTKLLEKLGVKPDYTNDGISAVKMANEKDYQLVFMDIHMPHMDGYEATRLIKENKPEVIVIGLSADVTSQSINKSITFGMKDYLSKPLCPEKLHKLLIKYFSAVTN
ncbi:ATP-binding protein [Winogradskyella marincola]|uniref:histidine kinase n=1 Tax=Winogradskyella marincola TaxID=3037795 RepID=A0ABT6FZ75_9FLAO|nr:ATP-binding protein [Winogradskyella sp. YYF002]MDG4715083.1 ATP-binding protein [Winogradskyella sp. YYF002]